MSLSVTILGSSAWYATRERAASGYLLEVNGRYVWMDAGGGTWRNLLSHIDFRDLAGVLITHDHPDHTTDVFQAYHARELTEDKPMEPIPLWAPKQTIDALVGFSKKFGERFELQPIRGGDSFEFAGAQFSFVETAHSEDTVGVRIGCDGAVLAYSADAGPDSDFKALAGNADLFLCEATFQDSDELWEGHLSAAQAGAAALDVGVKKLVLTHLPPNRDLTLSVAQANGAFDGIPVELATDGARYEIAR